METALWFRHRSLDSSSPLLLISNVSNSPTTKLPVTFRNSSLLFTSGCMRRSFRHMHRPMICAINKLPMPRKNNGDDEYNMPKFTLPATVALACVLGFMCSNCRMYSKAIAQASSVTTKEIQITGDGGAKGGQEAQQNFSMTPKAIASERVTSETESSQLQEKIMFSSGRKAALLSLLNARHRPSSSHIDKQRKTSSQSPKFNTIQKDVFRSVNRGRVDEAVKKLKQYKANKEYSKEKDQIDMLLLEMYIWQGEFEEALKCECLQTISPSDARIPLYKAILYTMVDNKDNAKKWWKTFVETPDGDETSS